MEKQHITLGMHEVYGRPQLFGLSETDRLQHLYLIGKSGSGKSTLLRAMLRQDIGAGRGVAFLDPHGDEAERLIDDVPRSRTDDFVYVDAADASHCVGLNLLEAVRPELRPRVAASIVATFKALWAESWGPRSEYILYNAVAALLEFPIAKGGATLLGVPRLLSDERYRARVLSFVRDPRVLAFWQGEFEAWPERLQAEAVAPLQNKAGRLLTPVLRTILGQVKSSIRPREIMDRGQVLIVNLAKGKIGEGDSNLLGSLLVTAFQLAAMERAEVPEEARRPFFLYIDEFHSFTTESFGTILSEARKYALGLVLSHQYTAQLPTSVLEAVLGNVGSLMSFRLGADDATALAREFAPYPAEALRALSRGQVCARLLRDGEVGEAFLGSTLPPLEREVGWVLSQEQRRATLLAQSRQRYGRPRERVEERLKKWFAYREEGRVLYAT